MLLFKLFAVLGLDTSEFEQKIMNAQKASKSMVKTVENVAKTAQAIAPIAGKAIETIGKAAEVAGKSVEESNDAASESLKDLGDQAQAATEAVKKSFSQLKSDSMKLAAQWEKAGMSMSEARSKAYAQLAATGEYETKAGQRIKKTNEEVVDSYEELGDAAQKAGEKTGNASKEPKRKWELFGKTIENISEKSFSKMISSAVAKATVFGNMVTGLISKVARASVGFSKESLQASADIEAEIALYEQVFGELESAAGGVLESISKDTNILATRLRGIGTSAFMQFKGAGVDAASALAAMDKYTRLAADAAAAYNISIEDADVKLRSFLRGNTEAGDSIGLFTSESQRNERAVAAYGAKWTELTEAQKQMLMLNVVDEIYTQQEILGQAAREGHEWENVIGNLNEAFTKLQGTVGGPFREALIPVIESLSGLLSNETFILRVGMLASGLGNIAGYVFDGAIGFIDELLKWSNGEGDGGIVDGILDVASGLGAIAGLSLDSAKAFVASLIENSGIQLKFDAPTWDEIKDKMETAVDSIVAGIKGIANWTLGAFDLPNVDSLIESLSNWWTEKGSNTYERVKSVLSWTLGEFVEPNTDSFIEAVKNWWKDTGFPSVEGALNWTVGELFMPAWVDLVFTVGDWWENRIRPKLKEAAEWDLGKVNFPTWEELKAAAEAWWESVTGLLSDIFTINIKAKLGDTSFTGQGSAGTPEEGIDIMTSASMKISGAGSDAKGLDYVPYNDYLTRLHVGEAVLTREEATNWRRGESTGTIDTAGIASAVAVAVREALNSVGVYMGEERVGDMVTKRVSRNIAKNARNRRYQPV